MTDRTVRKPSSTNSQRNRRVFSRKSMMTTPRTGWEAMASHRDLASNHSRMIVSGRRSASRHGAVAEQPQDDPERDQPHQAIGAEVFHEGHDVGGHVAEKWQVLAADQQCTND